MRASPPEITRSQSRGPIKRQLSKPVALLHLPHLSHLHPSQKSSMGFLSSVPSDERASAHSVGHEQYVSVRIPIGPSSSFLPLDARSLHSTDHRLWLCSLVLRVASLRTRRGRDARSHRCSVCTLHHDPILPPCFMCTSGSEWSFLIPQLRSRRALDGRQSGS